MVLLFQNEDVDKQHMTNSTLVSPVKMEYGWNFSISGLKVMMKSGLGKTFLKLSMRLPCHFHYWILIKSTISVINNMVSAWRNFENIFPRPLFIIIFRPVMLKFHPYSILTGDTKVEFVIYGVLMAFFSNLHLASFFSLISDSLDSVTVYDEFISGVPGQNGIWVKF